MGRAESSFDCQAGTNVFSFVLKKMWTEKNFNFEIYESILIQSAIGLVFICFIFQASASIE